MKRTDTPISRRTSLHIICGLILLAGLPLSCGKEYKVTRYEIIFGTAEISQPRDITDPDLLELYMQILSDCDKLKARVDDSWQVDVVNDHFKPEDEKAEAKYNDNLPKVKEFEAACRKKIEEFGTRSGSSFHTRIVYYLRRSVPADNSLSATMLEYSFELRYN